MNTVDEKLLPRFRAACRSPFLLMNIRERENDFRVQRLTCYKKNLMLLQINTAAFAFVAESLNRVITNQMLKHSVYVTQIEFDLSPQEQVAQYE